MRRAKIAGVLIAPMLLLACGEPAQEAGPGPSVSTRAVPAAEAGPTLTSAEAQSVLDAAVRDRTAGVLPTPAPDGPSLDETKSSDKFKAARDRERVVVAERKVKFHRVGFHYTSAVTTVLVTEVSGTASRATVRFDETGTLFLASDATGPSDVPEQYRIHATATFLRTGHGWVLDEVLPDDGPFGLPFSMVDPRLPSDTAGRP